MGIFPRNMKHDVPMVCMTRTSNLILQIKPRLPMFPNNIAGGNGLTRGSLHRHGFTQNNYTSEAKSGEEKKS